MITVSLCMIVKNEEKVLARCLDSVMDLVEEIIIVDTDSVDRTKEIAARYTEKIFDFEWTDDFSAARNFSFSKASCDFQMWLDADDVFPAEEKERFLELKRTLPSETDMVAMKYHTSFDKSGNPLLTSTRERLIRRSRGYLWQDPVHECISLSGNVYYSEIAIHHRKPPAEPGAGPSMRNLGIYRKLALSGNPMTPRQTYYFARELKDHGMWAEAAFYFRRFLEGGKGWEEDNIAACHGLAVCLAKAGDEDGCLYALVKSFTYAPPRSEICCELGYFYKRRGEYKKALDWFSLASETGKTDSPGFVFHDYAGYIPNIECCVCACNLGLFREAYEYNEKAGECKPGDPSYLHNKKYLEHIIAGQTNAVAL